MPLGLHLPIPRLARPVLLALLLTLGSLPGIAANPPLPPPAELPLIQTPPDPLRDFAGRPVRTARDWAERRRPELKRLFEHYMYGSLPPRPPRMEFRVERVRTNALAGRAVKKEIIITLGDPPAPQLHLLLLIPTHRSGPAPAFVSINFCGNHTLLPDPDVALPQGWFPKFCPGCEDQRATERGRGAQASDWAIENTIERGYAFASFYHGDVEPDQPGAPGGIRQAFRHLGLTNDWGTIAAWAWGVSRAVDWLEIDPAIDRQRIAVVGHSRNGKAALVAAAFDERIALAIPLQAGCGGTAPSRGTIGESVRQINDRFPHWFNDAFKQFNDQPGRLPFDQHCLIALCAPRPVLLPNAVEDTWANPAGQFEMLRAAHPVYQLLGSEGCRATTPPPVGTLVDSPLGYFIRPGKHAMTPQDWKVFLDFADRHFFGRSPRPAQ